MLLVLVACHPVVSVESHESPLDPDQRGPYVAGTYEDAFTSSSGIDLPVQAWFPSEDADDTPYAYDDFLTGTAMEDAVPLCDAPRPVLMFSHGSGGIRYQSIYLTEHLASRGWIVVAPDHVGNTFFDDFEGDLGDLALRRPIDIADAFSWLTDVAAGPGGPLQGCVDASAGYAVAGHSFGGYTTVALSGAELDVEASAAYCADHDEWLCDDFAAVAGDEPVIDRSDARVWAGVAMAPAGYEVLVGGLAEIDVPMLLLGGSMDDSTPMTTQVSPMYQGLISTPRMLGELADAGHFTFSDACAMVDTFPDCDAPYLDPEVAHPLLATVTTAFLELAQGDEDARAWLPGGEQRWTWSEGE